MNKVDLDRLEQLVERMEKATQENQQFAEIITEAAELIKPLLAKKPVAKKKSKKASEADAAEQMLQELLIKQAKKALKK
jgi:hypothetical protein